MNVKIKICGITNDEDALELSRLDIFALGVIISAQDIPSKVDPCLASKII